MATERDALKADNERLKMLIEVRTGSWMNTADAVCESNDMLKQARDELRTMTARAELAEFKLAAMTLLAEKAEKERDIFKARAEGAESANSVLRERAEAAEGKLAKAREYCESIYNTGREKGLGFCIQVAGLALGATK